MTQLKHRKRLAKARFNLAVRVSSVAIALFVLDNCLKAGNGRSPTGSGNVAGFAGAGAGTSTGGMQGGGGTGTVDAGKGGSTGTGAGTGTGASAGAGGTGGGVAGTGGAAGTGAAGTAGTAGAMMDAGTAGSGGSSGGAKGGGGGGVPPASARPTSCAESKTYPVWCPATSELPAACWTHGTACSTVVRCADHTVSCASADQAPDCDKNVCAPADECALPETDSCSACVSAKCCATVSDWLAGNSCANLDAVSACALKNCNCTPPLVSGSCGAG